MADLGDLARTWRVAARGGLIRNLRPVLEGIAQQAQADARTFADQRMTRRTGRLHRSIRAEVFDDFNSLDMQLTGGGSDAPHTRYLEDGTRRITARRFLRDAHEIARRRFGPALLSAGAEALSDV
jgi:hypothetical protein